MIKKILVIYTGGTICSSSEDGQRKLNTAVAKKTIIENFSKSSSVYADIYDELFVDSDLNVSDQTLSENMTLSKLSLIISHIKSFNQDDYSGFIVMHGTDTLAYTSALFSFVFSNTQIPVMLVSGNRPPLDKKSNANANFRVAVELIMNNIAPNVYVPYRNSDGQMYLHLASTIMTCGNFSEDFYNAFQENVSDITGDNMYDYHIEGNTHLFEKFSAFSKHRMTDFHTNDLKLTDSVLYISPYPGLDYSSFTFSENIQAVVHGTYHSGTVCVERNDVCDEFSSRSILWLINKCKEKGILLVIAPSAINSDQYSSMHDVAAYGNSVILPSTSESAYAKCLCGIALGLRNNELIHYLKSEINHEFIPNC